MDTYLLQSPNIIFDCAMLLYNQYSGESCRKLKLSVQKRSGIEEQVLNSCFDSIISLCEGVYDERLVNEVALGYLFQNREEIDGCFAFYILHDIFRLELKSLEDAISQIKSISRAHFFVNLYSLLLRKFPDTDYDGIVSNYSELINFIGALPISSDLKWEICSFYNSFGVQRDRLADIMQNVGKNYNERYDTVKHYAEWFKTNYEQNAAQDPIKYLAENYGISQENSPDTLFILPSITMPAQTLYLMNYTGEEENDFLYVGALFDPLRGYEDAPADSMRLFRVIRALGDSSKFEIVRLLGDSPKYGQQLAELLEITTATISHHMSQLIELEIVKTERESNRVYYSLNDNLLRDVAIDFSRIFSK